MKIPLSWIKHFVNIEKSPQEISDLLTLAGVEVEKIERLHFSFEGVKVGLVKEVYPHENADKLRVAKVSDGKSEYTVVCGAPNLEANKKVAFAPLGAILDTNTDKPFTLKKAKIRGVESKGMLCSAKELGIGADHDGIIFLDDAAPVGMDFVEYYKDPVFDITLTPNLGHCRSVLGIARELARYCEGDLMLPEAKLEKSTGKKTEDMIALENQEGDLCKQYALRIVTGVEVKPSPPWMKSFLEKVGITPINNVVDVTNFVAHELGQPLHAFDYNTISDKKVTIRLSREGEALETLDGKERKLDAGHIVIASGDQPIALGGIMGGMSTSVTENTHTVLLEAAEFCGSTIRKSSRNLKLRSDASSRFENGIDRGAILFALDYAAYLLQEIAGGSAASGALHQTEHPFRPSFQTARLSFINKILGTKLSLNEVESFLLSLGFSATTDGDDLFQLKTPSWRNDIKEEIDIAEEVARVYGYNNICTENPKHITSKIPHHPLYLLEKLLRTHLASLGLNEFLTCSLISKELCDLNVSHGLFEVNPAKVMHAKSVDQSYLRPSLLPGMLACMERNKNNGNHHIAAFEIGKIFSRQEDNISENSSLGILLSGNLLPHHFEKQDEALDFFHLKGILENLCKALFIEETHFERSGHNTFHPGVQADVTIQKETIATFGKVHPTITSKLKLPENTFFAEVSLYHLEKLRKKSATYKKISTLPSTFRDVTFTMKKEKELAEIFSLLEKAPFAELKHSELRGVYVDEKESPDTKNVTFRFLYRDDLNTLDDERASSVHEKLLSYLSKAL
ncbi:phenylalanine--tRNA ligase subunit beta [bacterium]|nr:phenylalanine--tRNA ligase subunit beta [bacterium]